MSYPAGRAQYRLEASGPLTRTPDSYEQLNCSTAVKRLICVLSDKCYDYAYADGVRIGEWSMQYGSDGVLRPATAAAEGLDTT